MFSALKNHFSNLQASSKLGAVLCASVLALFSTQISAQTATCAANESLQSYTFASPNNWPAGAGSINYTLGTGASSIVVSGTADLTNIVTGNPTTAQSGGFADTYYYLVDRPTTAGSNTVTFTFSKPISKLQLTATDLDAFVTANGSYQDSASIVGSGPSGAVTPTVVAQDATRVTVVGNVATASVAVYNAAVTAFNNGNTNTAASNCTAAQNNCNAIYSFAAPITSFTMTYGNGPLATGNPVNQVVGLAG